MPASCCFFTFLLFFFFFGNEDEINCKNIYEDDNLISKPADTLHNQLISLYIIFGGKKALNATE